MNAKKHTTVSCPTCGKPVVWNQDSPWRPFCSERCKLIDLGDWIMEKNRIPAEEAPPNPDADGSDSEG